MDMGIFVVFMVLGVIILGESPEGKCMGCCLRPSLQCKNIFFLLALLSFYFRSFHCMMRADPTVVGDGVMYNKSKDKLYIGL